MKNKTAYLSTLILFLSIYSFLSAQTFESKDNSKQINLPNNVGTVNINNYLSKSDDYKALTKQLDDFDKEIKDKREDCAAFELTKSDRVDKCQQSLVVLTSKRNSMENNIKRFKEDVQRLAETFSNININSERLRKAKVLFDEGRIRDVQFVMNDKEMAAEGDLLLNEKERSQRRTQRIDSLLAVKAEEYRVKAQAKAADYADPLRIDSTVFCFQQSLRYFNAAQTLYDFAKFYQENNLYDTAIVHYQKILAHPQSEYWQIANAHISLGELYMSTGDLDKAMASNTKAYQAYTPLSKNAPDNTFYKQNLAAVYGRLGETHKSLGNLDTALGFYEACNYLEKELYVVNPTNVYFKNGLATSYCFLGMMNTDLGNLDKALGFYEVYNRLEKELYVANPTNVEFKNGLAISFEKLGNTHTALGNLDKALGFYEEDVKLSKELYVANPNNVEFKNGLATSYCFLGIMHTSLGNLDTALSFYKVYNRLENELYAAYPTNVIFKNGLAISYEKLGNTHTSLGNLDKALGFYEVYNRLEKELYAVYPTNVSFKNGLAISCQYLGTTYTKLGNFDTALGFYEVYNRLEKELYAAYPTNVSFKNGLAISYHKLGAFSRDNLKDKTKARVYFKQAEVLWKELVRDAPQYVQFQKFFGSIQRDLKALD
jgi:tetratricopeptide (TPR) repeat protein